MPENAPAPWMMFVIMFVLLSLIIGLMILVAGVSRVLRGESFWVHDQAERPSPTRSGVRSQPLRMHVARTNTVQRRSSQQNAEKPGVQSVQPFGERSNVQPSTPAIVADIPTSVDEMQRLAHTIALYTKRPNKELAIREAWGATKGESDLYARASRLFDTAMSDAARQAAKAKSVPLAREVEIV